jgi:hypothetical protein
MPRNGSSPRCGIVLRGLWLPPPQDRLSQSEPAGPQPEDKRRFIDEMQTEANDPQRASAVKLAEFQSVSFLRERRAS